MPHRIFIPLFLPSRTLNGHDDAVKPLEISFESLFGRPVGVGVPGALGRAETFGEHLVGDVGEAAELRRPQRGLHPDDVAEVLLGLQREGLPLIYVAGPVETDLERTVVVRQIQVGVVRRGDHHWGTLYPFGVPYVKEVERLPQPLLRLGRQIAGDVLPTRYFDALLLLILLK